MKLFGGLLLTTAALLVLTGCSSAPEPKAPVEAAVLPSASPSAVGKALKAAAPSVNPNAQVEKQFTEFALMRASVHSVSKKPSEKAIVAALHAFCEDGEPFKLAKSKAYNENMDYVADTAYCDMLAN